MNEEMGFARTFSNGGGHNLVWRAQLWAAKLSTVSTKDVKLTAGGLVILGPPPENVENICSLNYATLILFPPEK